MCMRHKWLWITSMCLLSWKPTDGHKFVWESQELIRIGVTPMIQLKLIVNWLIGVTSDKWTFRDRLKRFQMIDERCPNDFINFLWNTIINWNFLGFRQLSCFSTDQNEWFCLQEKFIIMNECVVFNSFA